MLNPKCITEKYKLYAGYDAKATEVDQRILDWKAFKVPSTEEEAETMLNGQKDGKGPLDQYLAFRHIRDQCRIILDVYVTVIASCQPPPIDAATMRVLSELGYNVAEMANGYNSMFVEKLTQLEDQQTKVQTLFDKMTRQCVNLRMALEPLAAKAAGTTWGYFARSLSQTPSVNAAVQARLIEMKAPQQAQQQEESKE